MPQAPRKDPNAQRAQDKESKRARGALSCAECRRLKLKCDKTVPCSSCKRRGCSAICPNGSLITGQGTRFVLADTEKLHQKIAQMSDRIRQLEDGLAVLQSTLTSEPHPLLQRDLLKVKSSIELHSAVEGDEKELQEQEEIEESQYIDAFGTLAIRDDGASTFYGRSAGSESLLIGELPSSPVEGGALRHYANDSQASTSSRHFPPEVISLSANFPLASSMFRPGIDLDYLVGAYLPPWQEACRLSQLYLEQAPWFFGAVTKRQLDEEILPMWYNEAPKPRTVMSPISPNATPSPSLSTMSNGSGERHGPSPVRGSSHDLGLLFVIFCFGSLTDMAMPPAPDNPEAEQYYQLTKACLTLEPVLERTPSVATVQTLSLMAIYEGLSSKENSIESTWALFGLATKLAQSIGLHRDCARWKLTPAEVQKRRALFWELFITDCWQSLATGRLATFSLPFVDCELPFDPDQTMTEDGNIQPSFPFWKARFGAECVSAVVQGTLTSRAPKYSIILELDRKVRDMDLPLYAQGPVPQGLGLGQTMSHFMPTNYRELTLLYIHRCFFAHAISSNPLDPIKSQYAPSFLAGYRSACTIIGSVKHQFSLFPAQIARFWVLWTHAFSASVMIASVATHSSKSKVAPAALLELKTACDLFESAASYGGRAVKFLPIIKRLQAKAQQVFRETNSGIPPKIPNDIFKPSQGEEEKDELSIFSGKTHTVTTKSTTAGGTTRSTGSSPQASGTSNMATSSRASSNSPRQAFTDNPSFAGVHPSLVNELNVFDGHIRAQIQNAYRAGGDVFGSAMVVDPQPRPQQPPPQAVLIQQQQQSVLQQQQQQHQQQFLQQMEHQQREYQRLQELERLEAERQEAERQEVARQQQLVHQQQETQRLHQEELRRMQQRQGKLDHQQRQEQYRQHLEMQQRQLQEQHHEQQLRQHRGSREYEAVRPGYPQSIEPDHAVYPVQAAPPSATSANPPHSLHRVSQSQSLSNIHHTYQQQSSYPPIAVVSRHASVAPPQGQPQQHQIYVVSPSEYAHHPDHSQASSHYASPATSYEPHLHSHPQSQQNSVPPTPVSTHSVESYPYWPSAPVAHSAPTHHHQAYNGAAAQNYHYTPEGALRGIAAEDPNLQETWQSYMNNVGSPRHLFDD